MSTPTTRRFPRSTVEAWPNKHPYAIERYSNTENILGWLLAGAIGIGFGLALVAWWSA